MVLFSSHKRFRFFVLGILFFLVAFFAGFFAGNVWNVRGAVVNQDGNVDIVKVLDLYSKTRSPEVNFDQFWQIWDRVKEKYVDASVDDVALFYGALGGLVQGIDDPYSVYLPPVKAEEFAKDLSGEFEGIGAEIGKRGGQLVVIAPLPGSPAQISGLRAGDKIYAIDAAETYDMTLEEAVLKIRGPKGTAVVLTVSHD
ncbi:MAG: PDZ domain-containing protein, partial [Patescibacteria group bacterium]